MAFFPPLGFALVNNPEGQSYQWLTTKLIKYKSGKGNEEQGRD